MNPINVDYTTIKAFVTARGLSVQWLDIDNSYHLRAIDGPFALACMVAKDSGADQTDFEANLKVKGNKTPSNNVTTRLEKSDRVRKYWSFKATATKNSSTAFLIKAPGTISVNGSMVFQESLTNDRLVFGGRVWGENFVNGDYIQLDVVDHENIFGQGIDYRLKDYREKLTGTGSISVFPTEGANAMATVPGVFVKPGEITAIENYTPAILYGGLWLRLTYVSVGTETDPVVYGHIIWDKKES